MNRFILLGIHLVSLLLLGLGWSCDMLKIDIHTHFIVDFNLFNEKRSVIGTLQSLWGSANYFPFSLIFLFGILIPVVKSAMIFYLLLAKNPPDKWLHRVATINKWAMADVFAISIFVAFLGADAMKNTNATLENGFYFFAAYVLLSGMISIFLKKTIKP